MKYPFLLDKSSVELFRFIIDSGEDDQISKALKNMVADRQLISREIDQLQGSMNLLDLDIDNYEKQLQSAQPVLEAADKIIALQSSIAKLNLLKELKSSILQVQQQKSDLTSRYDKSIQNLVQWRNLYQYYSVEYNKLNHYKDLFSNLHILIGDLSDTVAELEVVSKIKNLPPLDTSGLTRLKELRESLNYIKEQKESLQIKPVIKCNYSKEDYDRLTSLKATKNLIDYTIGLISKHNSDLEKINSSILEYKELKTLFDICPVCGNKIH